MRASYTHIRWNGSKYAGQEPDSLERLLEVLDQHELTQSFYPFVSTTAKLDGSVEFFGNFDDTSHAFSIQTNDPDVMERLYSAIGRNGGYTRAKASLDARFRGKAAQ